MKKKSLNFFEIRERKRARGRRMDGKVKAGGVREKRGKGCKEEIGKGIGDKKKIGNKEAKDRARERRERQSGR